MIQKILMKMVKFINTQVECREHQIVTKFCRPVRIFFGWIFVTLKIQGKILSVRRQGQVLEVPGRQLWNICGFDKCFSVIKTVKRSENFIYSLYIINLFKVTPPSHTPPPKSHHCVIIFFLF